MDINPPEEAPKARFNPFTLASQKVDLDIDFGQRIKGTTHLTLYPDSSDLAAIWLNARQCAITSIQVNGVEIPLDQYSDPCDTLSLHLQANVKHHERLADKIWEHGYRFNAHPELCILLPEEIKDTITQSEVTQVSSDQVLATLSDVPSSQYTPLEVVIEFWTVHTRDILQFSQGLPGSGRWPHVYTRGGFTPGRTSCLFPCLDTVSHRCAWEISITGPRTVGDAVKQMTSESVDSGANEQVRASEAREMVFVRPGEITDEIVSKNDPTRKTVSFIITQNTSAQHLGFAIGPFEKVDLGALRDIDQVELLGENAAPILAYCLPGRKEEVESTCLPLTKALDDFVVNYSPYPFDVLSFCFVDDQGDEPASFAGLTICSSRMLYPDSVIDPAQEVTRTLVRAVAVQWLGIFIIPQTFKDAWLVVGFAIYIAELFMRELCGHNEYRFWYKTQADKVCALDYQRPAIYDMGELLHVDPAEYEFLSLKAPVVLYILDRRIAKTLGTPKLASIISNYTTKARNEDLKDNVLSTDDFQRVVDKTLHDNINDFMTQWVKTAGCPRFTVSQRFNKKKLVIEMTIRQVQ
ncbi:Transcription initiation factor TFIID subunit 2, partial [Elasticomyces elasticus]